MFHWEQPSTGKCHAFLFSKFYKYTIEGCRKRALSVMYILPLLEFIYDILRESILLHLLILVTSKLYQIFNYYIPYRSYHIN